MTFIHATDMHNNPDLLNRMVEYINYYNEYISLGDSRRVKGTKSYDCFNVVGVDTDLGLLKLIRVDNNVDHYMREKKELCFDYINKKVIFMVDI